MATIVPHSQLLAKAAEYILSSLAEAPQQDIETLVDDASMRFNLSPLEADSLLRLIREAQTSETT